MWDGAVWDIATAGAVLCSDWFCYMSISVISLLYLKKMGYLFGLVDNNQDHIKSYIPTSTSIISAYTKL